MLAIGIVVISFDILYGAIFISAILEVSIPIAAIAAIALLLVLI